jgi:hypothetical protein
MTLTFRFSLITLGSGPHVNENYHSEVKILVDLSHCTVLDTYTAMPERAKNPEKSRTFYKTINRVTCPLVFPYLIHDVKDMMNNHEFLWS